jgi:hypothetical protein
MATSVTAAACVGTMAMGSLPALPWPAPSAWDPGDCWAMGVVTTPLLNGSLATAFMCDMKCGAVPVAASGDNTNATLESTTGEPTPTDAADGVRLLSFPNGTATMRPNGLPDGFTSTCVGVKLAPRELLTFTKHAGRGDADGDGDDVQPDNVFVTGTPWGGLLALEPGRGLGMGRPGDACPAHSSANDTSLLSLPNMLRMDPKRRGCDGRVGVGISDGMWLSSRGVVAIPFTGDGFNTRPARYPEPEPGGVLVVGGTWAELIGELNRRSIMAPLPASPVAPSNTLM